MALKKMLPEGFAVFVERPFVVVGDGPAEDVQAICRGTVRWTVDKLKRDYFAATRTRSSQFGCSKTTPATGSTRNQCSMIRRRRLTDIIPRPTAPIMNIETGTGTLVHEIVHPYVRANFRRCPAWLNEGLGSLYEQCGERDGHIVGYPNWRLPGLQQAIKRGVVPSFEELVRRRRR